MQIALSFVIFIAGTLMTFMHILPDILSTWVLPGMFLMVMGAVQMAYIVSGGVLAHTPPALEPMFRNEQKMLWLFAPTVALAAVLIRLILTVMLHQG
jgi:hypothetical protein